MTLVKQRTDGDCGIAALTTLLSDRRFTYAAVYRAAIRVRPDAPIQGLQNRQLIAVAIRLGIALAPTRTYDLDRDVGVLRLYAPQLWPGGHFAAVRDGLVWDPLDADAAPWRVYRRRRRAKFGTLLRVC